MDSLTILHERISSPQLTEPGPNQMQKEVLFKAALRAPDHGALRPWRFLLIEGEARTRFANALYQIKLAEQANEQSLSKAQRMPMRAPSIIVVIASPKLGKSNKISLLDQQYSAAAAAQNIILAVEAQGLGAIWRTGWPAVHDGVNKHLNLQSEESIVGFIYVGTRVGKRREIPQLEIDDFVEVY